MSTTLKHLDDQTAPLAERIACKRESSLAQGRGPQVIRRPVTGCRGRHVAYHHVRATPERIANARRNVRIANISNNHVSAADRLHFGDVERNHPSRAVPGSDTIDSNLCPSSGRSAQIDNLLAPAEKPELVVELDKFERRTRTQPESLCFPDKRIVELPIKPSG